MSVRILVGDAVDHLRALPAASVHCVVTSPPYWGLRKYNGGERMIGLEKTFDEHLERLVEVFREVRRVMRPDGTLWLNYSSCYASGSGKMGWSADGGVNRGVERRASHGGASIRSLQNGRAPSSDKTSTALRDCQADDCVCSGLCGECQAAIRGRFRNDCTDSHVPGSTPDVSASVDQNTDYSGRSPQAPSLPVSLASKMPRSSPPLPGECSPADIPVVSADQSATRSSVRDVPACVCKGCGLDIPGTSRTWPASCSRTGSDFLGSALPNYTIAPHKPKDLINMSAFVAEALRADGWWLRSEIIISKKNPMPESCTDRPTSAHEKLFLFSQSGSSLFWAHRGLAGVRSKPDADYVWRNRDTGDEVDLEPLGWRETLSKRSEPENPIKLWRRVNLWDGHDYFYDADAVRTPTEREVWTQSAWGSAPNYHGDNPRESRQATGGRVKSAPNNGTGANLRNVWSISTFSFSEAHFATFSPKLVEPCIKAGTSQHGVCAECGAPWAREVETSTSVKNETRRHVNIHNNTDDRTGGFSVTSTTTGWRPTCDCGSDTVPATVLDCFGGAGTVGLVAQRLQRNSILIEISEKYAEMSEKRIYDDAPLLADVHLER